MPYSFAAYEFLVYVMPGGLLTFFFIAMFPGVRAMLGAEPVNVGGLVLFLVVAFMAGMLLQSISFYTIQKIMMKGDLAHRADLVIWKDQKVLPDDTRNQLMQAVEQDFRFPKEKFRFAKSPGPGEQAAPDGLLTEWQHVIRRIHSKVNLDKWSDRLEIYSMHYAVNLGAVVAFCLAVIVLVAIFLSPRYQRGAVFSIQITRVPRWLQPLLVVSLLVAVVVAIDRTNNFDLYLQTNCSVPTWRVEK